MLRTPGLVIPLWLAAAGLAAGQAAPTSPNFARPPGAGAMLPGITAYGMAETIAAPSAPTANAPVKPLDVTAAPIVPDADHSTHLDLGCPAEPVTHGWVSGEYLYWFLRGSPLPVPLVTGGAPADAVPGALGQAGTRVFFGGQPVNGENAYSGLRVRAGYDLESGWGIDVGGFLLEQHTTGFSLSSEQNANAVFGRPFFSAPDGVGSIDLLSFPGAFSGSVLTSLNTRLWGAEANLGKRVSMGPINRVYVGFRYLGLKEQLEMQDSVTRLPGGLAFFDGLPIAVGDVRLKDDRFETDNQFYGGQIGLQSGLNRGRWDLNVRTAVALGATRQELTVDGSTTLLTTTGQRSSLPGGLLALPSNSGRSTHDAFTVVPEVDASIGYRLAPWARVSVGYNFLYWSNVIRPGDQVDPHVDLRQVPISPSFDPSERRSQPESQFRQTDLWSHGINFGLKLSF